MPDINKKALSERDICTKRIAGQRRIVAKVEELLRGCDQLEAHLATARTTATHLLDATLRQLLAA